MWIKNYLFFNYLNLITKIKQKGNCQWVIELKYMKCMHIIIKICIPSNYKYDEML